MQTPHKVLNRKKLPLKSASAIPELIRPELTAEEIAILASLFDAKGWDATANADRAAEKARVGPQTTHRTASRESGGAVG